MARYAGSLLLGLLLMLGVFVVMQGFLVNRQFQSAASSGDVGGASLVNLGNQSALGSQTPLLPDKPGSFHAPPFPEDTALTGVQAPDVPAPAMAIPGFKPVFVTGAVESLAAEETATAEPAVAVPSPSAQQTVIAAGDLVLVERVQPKYPDLAVREGIESGSVTVKFMVQPDGSVSNPVVTDAKPRRDVFDQAALRAITHWKFKPIAAARESSITLEFKLAGGG